MSNLYNLLGAGQRQINVNISKDLILSNVEPKYRSSLGQSLINVDSIILRYSFDREDGPIQAIEVSLNTPGHIDEIAKLLQKAIKYRVLFIFEYQSRYLLMLRNFKVTESTGHVYTESATDCSDWIYDEELSPDNFEPDIPLGNDIERNVLIIKYGAINSGFISMRHLADWLSSHAMGERIELRDIIRKATANDAVYVTYDHMFFDKDQLSFICADLQNSCYITEIGRTGRHARNYMETVRPISTFAQEYDYISYYYSLIDSFEPIEYYDFCDYKAAEDDSSRELLSICRGMCSRVAV